jgi:hypothetical protein
MGIVNLMVSVIAQANEAVQLGTQFVEKASGFGGEVWLLSLVLLFIALLIAFYTWKIGIPNANAHRENSKKLADAISVMSVTTVQTNEQVNSSSQSLGQLQTAVRVMASCRAAECSALERVADKTGVDVSKELGIIQATMTVASEVVSNNR